MTTIELAQLLYLTLKHLGAHGMGNRERFAAERMCAFLAQILLDELVKLGSDADPADIPFCG